MDVLVFGVIKIMLMICLSLILGSVSNMNAPVGKHDQTPLSNINAPLSSLHQTPLSNVPSKDNGKAHVAN